MALELSILYRGSLSSCNYGCEYCPFAKRSNTAAELAQDQAELDRLVAWVSERDPADNLGILFTPWGEALIHGYYQQAIVRLSHLPQVRKVAIQTNLAGGLDWVPDCNLESMALWTTFHPGEVEIDRFLAQCRALDKYRAKYSVGIVGLKEHQGDALQLRQSLDPVVYLWVNAYKRQVGYYDAAEVDLFTQIDPLFAMNNQVYDTLGKPCNTGHTVVSVDGDGTMRRCHFVPEIIGNVYDPSFQEFLFPRTCQNQVCRCHIGYVHLPELNSKQVYGDGILERIPV
jgi:sulfatase maturation enzyme AslB (radical SAM superfamily)